MTLSNKHIFILLASALLLSSCEYELDVTRLDRTPRLFVLGVTGGSDTTAVRLLPAKAIGDTLSPAVSLAGTKAELLVNGEKARLEIADGSDPKLPEGSCYTLHPVCPGDKVEFRAETPGLEPVSAESIVPEEFPEHEIKMETKVVAVDRGSGVKMETLLNIKVSFDDDPDAQDFYGIRVQREYENYGYANHKKEYNTLYPVSYSSDMLGASPANSSFVVSCDLGSGVSPSMMVYDDKSFEDGRGELEFLAPYIPDEYRKDYYGEYARIYRYRLFLYRISPELYRFLKSEEIVANSIHVLLVTSPPSYVYTNVRGGVGVFGGLSCITTSWLPNVNASDIGTDKL